MCRNANNKWQWFTILKPRNKTCIGFDNLNNSMKFKNYKIDDLNKFIAENIDKLKMIELKFYLKDKEFNKLKLEFDSFKVKYNDSIA